jgi:TetR/AcrR family transcriptional regulator, transcriptional repressor for nem operon
MNAESNPIPSPASVGGAPARQKLLAAAITLIRRDGYAATSVDDLCRAAGVTKGAFFHHFASKDRLAVAAAGHFTDMAAVWFQEAPFLQFADPADRVLGYVDFRLERLSDDLSQCSCLLGTLVQEAYATSPDIREACFAGISRQARGLEPDIAAALSAHGLALDPGALALHTQAVLQGAFILAKAAADIQPAVDSLLHLKRYLALLFNKTMEEGTA